MFLFIRKTKPEDIKFVAFKYISCSYLSLTQTTSRIDLMRFKYISCSYLSNMGGITNEVHGNSNTSHVLIYPTFFQRFCILLYSSTSHFSSIFFYFYQVHCIFSLYLIFHLELLIFMVSQTF